MRLTVCLALRISIGMAVWIGYTTSLAFADGDGIGGGTNKQPSDEKKAEAAIVTRIERDAEKGTILYFLPRDGSDGEKIELFHGPSGAEIGEPCLLAEGQSVYFAWLVTARASINYIPEEPARATNYAIHFASVQGRAMRHHKVLGAVQASFAERMDGRPLRSSGSIYLGPKIERVDGALVVSAYERPIEDPERTPVARVGDGPSARKWPLVRWTSSDGGQTWTKVKKEANRQDAK